MVGNLSEWTLRESGKTFAWGRYISVDYRYKSVNKWSLTANGCFNVGYKNSPEVGFRVCIY